MLVLGHGGLHNPVRAYLVWWELLTGVATLSTLSTPLLDLASERSVHMCAATVWKVPQSFLNPFLRELSIHTARQTRFEPSGVSVRVQALQVNGSKTLEICSSLGCVHSRAGRPSH
jgi:hypothetical protein